MSLKSCWIVLLFYNCSLAPAFSRLPSAPKCMARTGMSRRVTCTRIDISRRSQRSVLTSDCIDISPGGDGGVIKRILRRGDPEAGFPRPRDVVELRWVLARADGAVIRRSEETATPFLHIVGQEESAVIPAWELAVPTMLQGEVAALIIAPQYGFGAEGAHPFVAGNETLLCEIHLLAIAPNALRKFQEIGENEDIREQLAESIYEGKSPVSDNVLRNRAVSEHKSATGPGGEPLMFDSSVHHLDPKRQVEGRAEGYRWLETPLLMEVEIELPPHIRTKDDIVVNLTKHALSVKDAKRCTDLLAGDLFGQVNPSCSSWVLLESSEVPRSSDKDLDPVIPYDNVTLKLNIEKSFISRDIWASLFK